MALFQQTASTNKKQPVYLFEANVGKLVQDPKTKVIAPGSLDKGALRVFRSRDDSLVHLTWEVTATKSKLPHQEPEDLIIFEGDCKAKLIPNKPGRVFFLKFEGVDDKKMFWFQSGDSSKDAEKIKELNEVLNNTNEIEEKLDPAGSRLEKSMPRYTGIRGLEEQIEQTDALLERLIGEHGYSQAGVVPGFEHLDQTRDEIAEILEELKSIKGIANPWTGGDKVEKDVPYSRVDRDDSEEKSNEEESNEDTKTEKK